jgi:hypothetical protein
VLKGVTRGDPCLWSKLFSKFVLWSVCFINLKKTHFWGRYKGGPLDELCYEAEFQQDANLRNVYSERTKKLGRNTYVHTYIHIIYIYIYIYIIYIYIYIYIIHTHTHTHTQTHTHTYAPTGPRCVGLDTERPPHNSCGHSGNSAALPWCCVSSQASRGTAWIHPSSLRYPPEVRKV